MHVFDCVCVCSCDSLRLYDSTVECISSETTVVSLDMHSTVELTLYPRTESPNNNPLFRNAIRRTNGQSASWVPTCRNLSQAQSWPCVEGEAPLSKGAKAREQRRKGLIELLHHGDGRLPRALVWLLPHPPKPPGKRAVAWAPGPFLFPREGSSNWSSRGIPFLRAWGSLGERSDGPWGA